MQPTAHTATPADPRLSPSERDKVAFLSSPQHYPERPQNVSVLETHHAWVFLTDRHAWKMKKPFRHGRYDCASLAARRHLCNEEYRLNLPLAPLTYLGVLPLVVDESGAMHIDGDGRPVEWLVKMHRLPEDRMLDNAAPAKRVGRDDIEHLVQKLLDFYTSAHPCKADRGGYVSRLRQELAETVRELHNPEFGFSAPQVDALADKLAAYIENEQALLDSRQQNQLVREIHGDLRPEHVCILDGGDIEILDRLEFDPDLRCLDCVEELAYFGLECRVLGERWIETACREFYEARHHDDAPLHLWQFYAARRAMVRAMLSAWHTLDGDNRHRWLRRGRNYLSLAEDYLDPDDANKSRS
jgi:aminoglycoside phosphotransferase family enzyme